MTATKQLLKAYQTEIDRLTKRSKFAETSFLTVYKLLAEAPDPVALVSLAAQDSEKAGQADVLRAENRRLRTEIEQSSREFLELKNQAAASSWLKERLQEYESKVHFSLTFMFHWLSALISFFSYIFLEYRWTSWCTIALPSARRRSPLDRKSTRLNSSH